MTDEDLMSGPDDTDLPDQAYLTDAEIAAEQMAEDFPMDEDDVLDVDTMEASMTAIGSVSAGELTATRSAIGSASVAGDVEISASVVGMLTAESVGVHQGVACMMMVDGDAAIEQGGAQLIVAQTAGLENGGVGILVANEVNAARSWVGVMAARNANISDDSRVIIDTRAALIIGGFLLGGMGLVACAVFLGARRIAQRMPHLPWAGQRGRHGHMVSLPHVQLPDLPKMPEFPKMPDLPQFGDVVARFRRAG
jgi:hypothetical protein